MRASLFFGAGSVSDGSPVRRLRFRLGNELPDMSMFEITLNGQRRTLPEAISVLQLLRQLGYETPRGVAVEVNREVVPALRHAEKQPAVLGRIVSFFRSR